MTEVVELRATHAATADDDNGRDHRAVAREDTLDANSTGDFADREGLADSASTTSEANTLERLEPLLVTFFDADVDTNGITGAERWQISAEPLFLGFDKWMHIKLGAEVNGPVQGSFGDSIGN